jgi:hypothetical protein
MGGLNDGTLYAVKVVQKSIIVAIENLFDRVSRTCKNWRRCTPGQAALHLPDNWTASGTRLKIIVCRFLLALQALSRKEICNTTLCRGSIFIADRGANPLFLEKSSIGFHSSAGRHFAIKLCSQSEHKKHYYSLTSGSGMCPYINMLALLLFHTTLMAAPR